MAKLLVRALVESYGRVLPKLDKVVSPGRSFHSSVLRCRELNVGIMGAGRVAMSIQFENILSNRKLNLKWVTEDNPAQVKKAQESFKLQNVPFFTSKDVPNLLTDKELDAVFLFVPTELHSHYACETMKNGKAVFVEKPVGTTIADIERCYEFSEKYGQILYTGFNRRFDPAFRNAVNACRNQSFGNIQLLTLASKDSPKPSYEFLKNCDKTGCNILSDMAVHDIDIMVWITKAERPESIYVTTFAHDVEMAKFGEADTMAAVLKYKSGILSILTTSRFAAYGHDIRMEIFGANGMATVENPRKSSEIIYDEAGSRSNRLLASFGPRFRESYIYEINHFIDCIEGKSKPLVTKEENLMTTEIIQKGLESVRENKTVFF